MQIVLYFVSILLTCALSGFLAYYAWRQRSVPGSRAFVGLELGIFLLALTETLSMLSPSPAQALFWFRVRYLPLAAIPVFWVAFALEYSGRGSWLSKGLLAGMFVVPASAQVLLWGSALLGSNALHGLWVRQEVSLHQSGPFWIADPSARLPGAGFLAHSFYGALLLLAGIVLLLITAWRMRHQALEPALLATGAALITLVMIVSVTFNLLPRTAFNPFTPSLGLSVLLTALAVFRFQFLKRAPAPEIGSEAHAQAEATRALAVFALMFIVMAVGVATVGVLSYQNYERQFRAQVESTLVSIAAIKMRALQDWRQERLGDANILYQNPAFSALVQRALENPADAQARAALQAWLERYQVHMQYDRVFLLDARGLEQIASPATPEPVAAHLVQGVADVLRAGQVTFVDFHRDVNGGPIHLNLLTPIFAAQDQRPLGVLVLRMDPRVVLYPLIQQWPIPSASAETLLIRRDGSDALFLNEPRFQAGAALNLGLPLENTQFPAVRAVLGQEGIVEGLDYRGVPVIADVRAVPGSLWFLVAKMDAAEVYAPLRERLWQTLGVFGLLVAASGAGLGLIWRQQRVRYYRGQVAAAQALRASEEKFSHLFQRAPLMITLSAFEDGKYLDVNDAFVAASGFSREEAIGATAAELGRIASPDRARLVETLRKEGRAVEMELTLYTKDKRPLVCLYNGDVISIGGKPCLLSIVQDITARKRAEEQLRIMAQLADNAPASITVHDLEGHFLYANQKTFDLHGYTREEFFALNLHHLDVPESAALIQSRIETIMKTGMGAFDVQHFKKDGSRIPVHVTVRMTEWQGERALLSIASDLTERLHAEEALRASEARFVQLFEQAPLGYQSLDADGRFLLVNQAWLETLGYDREEVVGKWFGDFLAPEYVEAFRSRFPILKAVGRIHSEFEMLHKRGERRLIAFEGRIARKPDGSFERTHCILQDITERRQAEAQIKSQLEELLRWQNVLLDRADREQELKREVNALCRRLGAAARYPSQEPAAGQHEEDAR